MICLMTTPCCVQCSESPSLAHLVDKLRGSQLSDVAQQVFHIINNQFGHKYIISGEIQTRSQRNQNDQFQKGVTLFTDPILSCVKKVCIFVSQYITSFMLPSRLVFLLIPCWCPGPASPLCPCLWRLAMLRGRVQ